MNKNTFLNLIIAHKSNVAVFCIVAMLLGFLVSPAILSMATIAFGVNALIGVHPREWLKNKWWLVGCCWVAVYALTWFWSANKGNWETRFQIKLTVLILPLAFSLLPAFTVKQKRIVTVLTALMFMAGACYSLSFLIGHVKDYNELYRTARTLPTPVRQDHIRFSLAIVLFIAWCFCMWPVFSRAIKWFVAIVLLFLCIYLHILAAKTGLVTLYLFFIMYTFYLLFTKRIWQGLFIIIAVSAFVYYAKDHIPTFKERIGYISYTYIMYEEGDKSGAYGDIGRLMSYDIAERIIAQHPWIGVGTGDMYDEMGKGYDKWYPQVIEENRLLPHNQFMVVALGCGIPAMLLFVFWALMPFAWARRNKRGIFLVFTWLAVIFQFMIDPALEIHNGVFLSLFFVLWMRHAFLTDGATSEFDKHIEA